MVAADTVLEDDPVMEAVVVLDTMTRGKLALDTTPLAPVAVTMIVYVPRTYGTLRVHPVSVFFSVVMEGPPEVDQVTTPALAFV